MVGVGKHSAEQAHDFPVHAFVYHIPASMSDLGKGTRRALRTTQTAGRLLENLPGMASSSRFDPSMLLALSASNLKTGYSVWP